MTELRAAADATPASWLFDHDTSWWDLVRFGPPGFPTYARVGLTDDDAVRTALGVLAGHTTSPDLGYAAVWEGWVSTRSAPVVPRVKIPDRTMPADRAWCLACEVDEEIEFTVACFGAAYDALAAALPAVRRADYGEETPLYREP